PDSALRLDAERTVMALVWPDDTLTVALRISRMPPDRIVIGPLDCTVPKNSSAPPAETVTPETIPPDETNINPPARATRLRLEIPGATFQVTPDPTLTVAPADVVKVVPLSAAPISSTVPPLSTVRLLAKPPGRKIAEPPAPTTSLKLDPPPEMIKVPPLD